MLTKGAAALAQIFHLKYQKSDERLQGHPVAGWETLSGADKEALVTAMQEMLDEELIQRGRGFTPGAVAGYLRA